MSTRGISSIVAFALVGGLGCEGSTDAPALGDLVYSGPSGGLYRLDRRVEYVASDGIAPAERPSYEGCGYLTERAEVEIDRVLAELDPNEEYEVDVAACQRRWGQDASSGKIHIEGFIHGPFICGDMEECCANELAELRGLYDRVVAYLQGFGEENDATLAMFGIETYPMIEAEHACR